MNPLQIFNQVVKAIQIVQTNPQELNKILLNNGRITQEQYEQIKDMSPSQTGEYLLNNGLIGQNQVHQMYSAVPTIQQMMNNNK